jgi:hypothetical protein
MEMSIGTTAAIEIPLGDVTSEHLNFTNEELELIHRMVYKLRQRNFDVGVPGYKYRGSIINAAVQPGSIDGQSLVISVQF